jgi:uncharacterized protein
MISAVVIGLLFGFVMQRTGFCGSALISSVFLYKDKKGIWGILLAIFISMLGFAVLAKLEWIIPNPNPMRLLSAVVGGLVFGVGMVLAGGCVTGTLYKAGEGRLTSILALVGIGIGANLVGYGLLAPLKKSLVLATRNVSLPSRIDETIGLDFWLAALLVGGIGLALVIGLMYLRRSGKNKESGSFVKRLVSGGWPVAVGGVLIGVIGWLAYLSSTSAGRNYPLGGTHGVMTAFSHLVGGHKSGSEWMMWSVAGIVVGSALSARMRRQLALRSADASTLIIALLGGILVGAGAILGRGCFTGNIISGIELLSLHSIIFAIFTVLANWVTTILYLRGTK